MMSMLLMTLEVMSGNRDSMQSSHAEDPRRNEKLDCAPFFLSPSLLTQFLPSSFLFLFPQHKLGGYVESRIRILSLEKCCQNFNKRNSDIKLVCGDPQIQRPNFYDPWNCLVKIRDPFASYSIN